MTSTQQWVAQVVAAAVLGWALGNLVLELVKGAAGMAWRRLRRWKERSQWGS